MIVKELNRLQVVILRTTKKIGELENERKTMQVQIQGEHKKIDLLAGLLAKEKKLLSEKKEDLYRVEFNLQKGEMKLERIRGHERDKSEAERKQTKIEELQAVLNERTATSKLLQNQIASLEVKFCISFFIFLAYDKNKFKINLKKSTVKLYQNLVKENLFE